MHATCAVNLALAHALLGEVPTAEAWLAEAERRAAASKRGLPTDPTMIAYARAVIGTRDGRAAAAARDLEERWNEIEDVTPGLTLRPLRVVRAFALAAAGGPREAGKAERLLSPPTNPGEYDFLGASWPEMAHFLAAHGLGGRTS